jgi:hypothetical protein
MIRFMADTIASYIPSDIYIKRFLRKEAMQEKINLGIPDRFPKYIDSHLA